jgi:hypothetical protein
MMNFSQFIEQSVKRSIRQRIIQTGSHTDNYQEAKGHCVDEAQDLWRNDVANTCRQQS